MFDKIFTVPIAFPCQDVKDRFLSFGSYSFFCVKETENKIKFDDALFTDYSSQPFDFRVASAEAIHPIKGIKCANVFHVRIRYMR